MENRERVGSAECATLDPTTQAERGAQRFSFKRVLIGAAIGAISLPVLAFGAGGIFGVFSNVSPSEIPGLISMGALQVITGALVGGIIVAIRR